MDTDICVVCNMPIAYHSEEFDHNYVGRGIHHDLTFKNNDSYDSYDSKIESLESRISELEKIVQGFKSVKEMRWRSYANARGKIFINDKECIEAAEKYIENFKGGKNV